MPRFAAQTRRYAEYSVLADPYPIGPRLGFYAGRPISGTVVDEFGHEYIYVGLAQRKSNGQYDVDSLAAGEWIVEPGLIYRRVPRALGNAGSGEPGSCHSGGMLAVWTRWFH